MIASLFSSSALGATQSELQALVPERILHCVSTAVDVKSAWCDAACNSEELKCPGACLCLAVPDDSARFARVSQAILLRLARRIQDTASAERLSELKTARAAAAESFAALTAAERTDEQEGSRCASLDPEVDGSWCKTICGASSAASGVCGMCVCERSLEAPRRQQQELEEEPQPPEPAQRMHRRPSDEKAWMAGYWSWSWNPNNGTANSTLGVQFSGEVNVTAALKAVGALSVPCDDRQREFCDAQVAYYESEGRSNPKRLAMRDFTIRCRSCLTGVEEPPARLFASGLRGAQYLALGGGQSEATWDVDSLSGLVDGGQELQAIKDAGFAGVCFDIEETDGESELISAFERSFAALQRSGLGVMVTTSRSGPYRASSEEARIGLVKSWIKSDDIQFLSPQLFTMGAESAPELEPSRGVRYEEYKHARAKLVPSIVSADQVDDVTKFFEAKGMRIDGFLQWQGGKRAARTPGKTKTGEQDANGPTYTDAGDEDATDDAEADADTAAPSQRACAMVSFSANEYWTDETCTMNCGLGNCPPMICNCD